MKSIKYYLETTVFNFVFADDALEKREITKKFLKIISATVYEIFISKTVIDEIDLAIGPKRIFMYELIVKFSHKCLKLLKKISCLPLKPLIKQSLGPLAQSAEQGTLNAKVGGSIPLRPTLEVYTPKTEGVGLC